jgi:hypothetical protein
MALFMDVHTGMQGMTADQLREAHKKDLELEGKEGVHFIKAWGDPTSGKAFCLAEGPDAEAVKRVHEKAGHPAQEIYPVPITAE